VGRVNRVTQVAANAPVAVSFLIWKTLRDEERKCHGRHSTRKAAAPQFLTELECHDPSKAGSSSDPDHRQ
jgi:hypothetical protein